MATNSKSSIFGVAIEIVQETERTEYLNAACNGNAQLREEIDRLILAHHNPRSILDSGRKLVPTSTVAENPSVGSYKLRDLIGEGAFGHVYLAEQSSPIRRQVAIKLIKPGMDSMQVMERFKAERQVLALMEHPNISRVLDGGMTDRGYPFFAMELVRGTPITEYCDAAQLSIKSRLELFAQVCQTVHFAHRKGIIHRDLKPSNIMVTTCDGKPTPKIIDFGIAKALDHRLTNHVAQTTTGQILGTPEYMSPEQATMSSFQLDVRSDVYSLGALFYELLTGVTPFGDRRLDSLGVGEFQRILLEEQPDRPSVRLTKMTKDELKRTASSRQQSPENLRRHLSAELDWIAMQAVENERSRRYDSAKRLADDVYRFLADRPVLARPSSYAYQLRKFVARNHMACSLGVLFAVFAIFSMSVNNEYARAASNAISLADRRLADSESARSDANTSLGLLVDSLGTLDNRDGNSKQVNGRKILGVVTKLIEANFELEPEQKALLQWKLGIAHAFVANRKECIALLENSHRYFLHKRGWKDRQTFLVTIDLASAMMASQRITEAFKLRQAAAEQARLHLDEGDELILKLDSLLARSLLFDGQYRKAIDLFSDVLCRRVENARLDNAYVSDMLYLGEVYVQSGQLKKGLEMREKAHAFALEKYGSMHPTTLEAQVKVAQTLLLDNRPEEATKLLHPVDLLYGQWYGKSNTKRKKVTRLVLRAAKESETEPSKR